MSDLKNGSLFSGYGGLDMAVEAVTGARTAWVSDIDKGACKILAHRYPDVPNHGDLTTINWAAIEPVDIITGGFPCQDLSHAGKRAGMTDTSRSGLWSYMCEAINIIRPRLVVAENVRGLLSAEALRPVEPCTWCVGDEPSSDLRALGAVLADLADIGYDASWYGLRAADVGACHGRFRVFLVAHPASRGLGGWAREQVARSLGGTLAAGSGANLLPTPTTTQRGTDDRAEAREGAGPNLHNAIALLPTPDASPEKYRLGGDSQQSKSLPAMAIRGELRLLPTPEAARAGGTPERHLQRKLEADGATRTSVTNLDVLAAGESTDFGQYAAAITRWESVVGRPAPSPTEPTGKNGAHRLSPEFTEWMMGLPAGWITDVPGITRNEALKACGNGVVPQQAAAALRVLLTATERAA